MQWNLCERQDWFIYLPNENETNKQIGKTFKLVISVPDIYNTRGRKIGVKQLRKQGKGKKMFNLKNLRCAKMCRTEMPLFWISKPYRIANH